MSEKKRKKTADEFIVEQRERIDEFIAGQQGRKIFDRQYCFQRCLELADKSDCQKLHYGCVIVQWSEKGDYGQIVGEGYNHVAHPSLKDSCCLRKDIPSGTRVEQCNAIHAEQAAFLDADDNAKKHGLEGATLFIAGKKPNGEIIKRDEKGFYCTLCARFIADAGINDIRVLTKRGEERMTLAEVLKYSSMVARGEKEVTWTK